MARWVDLDDCVEISAGEMKFYPVELLGDIYEDVAPVVHGHWENVEARHCNDDGELTWTAKMYKCSVCECFTFNETLCCPNCGAKMDEKMSK